MAYFSEHGLALTLVRKVRRMRRKWFNRLLKLKLKTPGGLSIDPSAHIVGLKHITIGRDFRAGAYFKLEALERYGSQTFSPRIVIKDHVEIHDFVHIGAVESVEIGNHVLMASKIYISDHNHGAYGAEAPSDPEVPPANRPLSSRPVVIEDNVWLGEFVTVLPGVTIGRGSVIGANSVVTGDIPPHSIAVGAPARVIKHWDEGQKRWLKLI